MGGGAGKSEAVSVSVMPGDADPSLPGDASPIPCCLQGVEKVCLHDLHSPVMGQTCCQ